MKIFLVDGAAQYKCLSRGFEALRSLVRHKKSKRVSVITRGGETMVRDMALIDVHEFSGSPTSYEPLGRLWADCVTGSLYDPETGACLSSDQMRIPASELVGLLLEAA